MAQVDGSITIETEVKSDGFKAGSDELLAAIKSLSAEVKNLGQTLKDAFTQPLTPTIDTSAADKKIAELEQKIRDMEAAASRSAGAAASGGQQPESIGAATQKALDLQRQIEAVSSSVDRLEPTVQRAMNGSESAITSFDAKADALEKKIAALQERLQAVGQTRYPTQAYTELTAQMDHADQVLLRLLDRQEKMEATGVKKNSKSWQALQYDIRNAQAEMARYERIQAEMQANGTAFTMGSDTAQYAEMEASLSAAQVTLAEMRGDVDSVQDSWQNMPTLSGYVSSAFESIRTTLSSIGQTIATVFQHPLQAVDRILGSAVRLVGKLASGLWSAAKTGVSKLATGLKSCVSHLGKMLFHGKSLSGQFSKLVSGAKRFTLGLLGARGVYALLRKVVSAYMAENKQLANTLSQVWTQLGSILGPIIERVINLIAQVVSYFTKFLSMLGITGKAASSSIASTGSTAKKETDKLQRQLASFDELNVLSAGGSDSSGSSGADGASGSAALPEVTMPDWAASIISQLKAGDWSGATAALAGQLNSMVANVDWAGIGAKIGGFVDKALSSIATFIKTFDWYALGADLATSINNIITSVDWTNLGTILGAKFAILVQGLGGLFATLDWSALGTAVGDVLMGLWDSVDWAQAGKTLSDGCIGLLDSLTAVIAEIDWQQVGNDIAAFLAAIDWNGLLDSIMGGIGAALAGIAELIWGLIEDAWDDVVSWWNENAYDDGQFTIEGLLDGIWEAIKNIGTWINDHIFKPFIDGFKEVFGIHSPSTVMSEQGGFLIDGLLQGIKDTWTNITTWLGEKLDALKKAIAEKWDAIKKGASEKWNQIKTSVSNAVTNAKTAAGKAWDGIKSKASTISDNVKTAVSTKWSAVKTSVSNAVSNAKTAAGKAWDGIKSKASTISDNVKTAVSTKWSDVKTSVSNAVTNAKTAAGKAWDGIKSKASTISDSVKTAVSTKWSDVKTTISNKMSDAKKAITDADWAGAGSGIWGKVKNGLTTAWSNVSTGISNAASNLTDKFKKAGGWSGIGDSIWTGLKTGLQNAWNNFTNGVSNITSGLINKFKGTSWTSIGENIWTGIKDGLKNAWSNLTTGISSVANGILNGVKNALGIHSPSTVFRDQVGQYIGLGIAEGMDGTQGAVVRSASGIAGAITDEMRNGDYTAGISFAGSELDGVLMDFSDRVVNGFAALADRLQAVADRVSFNNPVVAGSLVPYQTAARADASTDKIGNAIQASNSTLSATVVRAIAQAAAAIVDAVKSSDSGAKFDAAGLTTRIVSEINRKTIEDGRSPLLI